MKKIWILITPSTYQTIETFMNITDVIVVPTTKVRDGSLGQAKMFEIYGKEEDIDRFISFFQPV